MLRRVLREQRRYVLPLAVVLAVNLIVFAAVVYPLDARVADASSRALAAQNARRAAQHELAAAQGVATGKVRAETELKTFYGQVLPAGVSDARRVTYLPIAQLARKDRVQMTQWLARLATERDSTLEQLEITLSVEGSYEDIRRFIYDIETAPAFVVIDSLQLEEGRDAGRPIVLKLGLSTYFQAANHAS